MENLTYIVKNTRSGAYIAAFILLSDAKKYIKELENREGVHSPQYVVIVSSIKKLESK